MTYDNNDGPIYSMLTGKGPLPGGGQTLNSFTLSGAPSPWGSNDLINGTYIDESNYGGPSGYNWVLVDPNSPPPGTPGASSGYYRINWWSDQGSCTCYDANYNVIGTRQFGAGWILYPVWGGAPIAFTPGATASIPPSTGWYKIYGSFTPTCSGPFGGDGSTAYGFSDCDPSIQPPTENWQPGYLTNLTFTPV